MLLDTTMAKIYGGQARRWARAWKRKAKMNRLRCRFLKREWGKSRGRYRARIAELEEVELRVAGLEDDILQGQARIAELEEALRLARLLLQETVDFHRDPESEEYNGCEVDPCLWCEGAQKVLDAD